MIEAQREGGGNAGDALRIRVRSTEWGVTRNGDLELELHARATARDVKNAIAEATGLSSYFLTLYLAGSGQTPLENDASLRPHERGEEVCIYMKRVLHVFEPRE